MALRVTRFLVEHLRISRQRRQCHSRKGIHYKVDPKHLRHGQRRVKADERSQKHYQTCTEIYRHLEDYETPDVKLQRASPHDRLVYARERVVDDRDIVIFHGKLLGKRISHLAAADNYNFHFLPSGFLLRNPIHSFYNPLIS